MYESIMNIHKKMFLERTYKKLVLYAENKTAHRDMKDDAMLLYRKHAFGRLCRTAEFLVQ